MLSKEDRRGLEAIDPAFKDMSDAEILQFEADNRKEMRRMWGDDFDSMRADVFGLCPSDDGVMLGFWFELPGQAEPVRVSLSADMVGLFAHQLGRAMHVCMERVLAVVETEGQG